MSVFNPQHQAALLQSALSESTGLVLVCYCAAWCDTCKTYETDFNTLASQYPQHLFVWIDIEENPEMLADEEIENFPTLLIQGTQGNLFFGPMLPQIRHLERLMRSLGSATPPIHEGPGPLGTLLASTA